MELARALHASIHEIDGRGCRFGPIEVWHVLLTHHGVCYLEYLSILPFGNSICWGVCRHENSL